MEINSIFKPTSFPDVLSLPSSRLLDDSMYQSVMLLVSSDEDDRGNYNYARVSNLGMIYLYVHRKGTKRKEQTKKDYLRELLLFLNYVHSLGKHDLRDISRFEVEQYQMQLEQTYPKTTTLAKKIGILNSFFDWLYREEYTTKNLTRGLIPVRIDKEAIPEREIDEEVLKESIQYFNNHPKVKSLLLLLGTTGLRLNEVITPNFSDLTYDRTRNRYYLRTVTKRGKIRMANIKDYVLEELLEYRRRLGLNTKIDKNDTSPFYPNRLGRHYSLSSLSSSLTEWMKESGLVTTQNQRVTPHYLRHYFAQAAFAAGAPIGHIAETLGHSLERTTKENYLRNSLKKQHDVSELVDIRLTN